MYNDYYLQQISSKLDDVIDNQELINSTIYSGDISFNEFRDDFNQFQGTFFTCLLFLLLFVCTILFYDFYHHLFTDKR